MIVHESGQCVDIRKSKEAEEVLQYFPAQKWTKFQDNQIFCCLSLGIPFDKVQRLKSPSESSLAFYNNFVFGGQPKKGKENPKTF